MVDIYHKLEGRYGLIAKELGYTLFLAGPNNSNWKYGEHFTYITERNHVEWGIKEEICGFYEIRDDLLMLHAYIKKQLSWDRKQQTPQGEAIEEQIDLQIPVDFDPDGRWVLLKQDLAVKLIRIDW